MKIEIKDIPTHFKRERNKRKKKMSLTKKCQKWSQVIQFKRKILSQRNRSPSISKANLYWLSWILKIKILTNLTKRLIRVKMLNWDRYCLHLSRKLIWVQDLHSAKQGTNKQRIQESALERKELKNKNLLKEITLRDINKALHPNLKSHLHLLYSQTHLYMLQLFEIKIAQVCQMTLTKASDRQKYLIQCTIWKFLRSSRLLTTLNYSQLMKKKTK